MMEHRAKADSRPPLTLPPPSPPPSPPSKLRYTHIADVITTLSTRIRDFVGSNSGAALASNAGADMSLSEMAAALKQLPEYKETMSKLSQHMYLAHQCMDVFGKQCLLDLSELEQTMGTGTDAEGKAPKAKVLIDDLIDQLAGIGTRKQAIRLIMIYIISQHGITVDIRKRLFDAAGLTGEEQVRQRRVIVKSIDRSTWITT